VICALVSSAQGSPILDGVRDPSYGSANAVQLVQTGFGDANPNGGSELDAAYARVEGGTLYLLLTGNLESNFNKLNIFFDSQAGGQNVLQTTPTSAEITPRTTAGQECTPASRSTRASRPTTS
jgi:hypothetical protein